MKIILQHSSKSTDNQGIIIVTPPPSESVERGELVINDATNHETFFIKNASNDIVDLPLYKLKNIGEGSSIGEGAHVGDNFKIYGYKSNYDNAKFTLSYTFDEYYKSTIYEGVTIGANVDIKNNVEIAEYIKITNDTGKTQIYDESNGQHKLRFAGDISLGREDYEYDASNYDTIIGGGVKIFGGFQVTYTQDNGGYGYTLEDNEGAGSVYLGKESSLGSNTYIGDHVNIPNNFKVQYLTKTQYDSLVTKDANTLYFIVE